MIFVEVRSCSYSSGEKKYEGDTQLCVILVVMLALCTRLGDKKLVGFQSYLESLPHAVDKDLNNSKSVLKRQFLGLCHF